MASIARAWDWVVALTMVVLGLVVQAIVSGLIAAPIAIGLESGLGIRASWLGVSAWLAVFFLLNCAGFLDYYVFHRVNRAGAFHLIPRAIERIRFGEELPNAIEASTGEPVDLQGPIRAGPRLLVGLVIILVSVAAVVFGAPSHSTLGLVIAAAGLIFFFVGLLVVAQAVLAYVGVIKRAQ